MALTTAELQQINDTVKLAILEAAEDLNKAHRLERSEAIRVHIESCPVGKSYSNFRASLAGMMAGVSFVGGLVGAIGTIVAKSVWSLIANGSGK